MSGERAANDEEDDPLSGAVFGVFPALSKVTRRCCFAVIGFFLAGDECEAAAAPLATFASIPVVNSSALSGLRLLPKPATDSDDKEEVGTEAFFLVINGAARERARRTEVEAR